MKKIFLVAVTALLVAVGMTSCFQDLNREPIDPNVNTSVNKQELFVKCYATLALTGQAGPAGNGDVDGMDEGTSSFYRMMYSLNEWCADQVYWIWPDVGLDDIRKCTWTSSNDLVRGLYNRLYIDINLCNYYIDLFGAESTANELAEIRFLRALNYYYLLDMFGNVPFVEHVGGAEKPDQIQRADLYDWLIKEIEEFMPNLAPAGQRVSYYRVDQAAAWMLLSRIYLNSAVYTGVEDAANFTKAADYANRVINSSYELASDYKYLFMGDNDNLSAVNDAYKEIILPVAQDGVQIQSYGGSWFLVASYAHTTMPAWGTTDSWQCIRSRAQLVQLFCPTLKRPTEATDMESAKKAYCAFAGGPAEITAAAGDDRALFVNAYELRNENDSVIKSHFSNFWMKNESSEFFSGWNITKFTNLMADPTRIAHDQKTPDTDIPLMRKAEAYLNYAEAIVRGGAIPAGGMTALDAVNAVRNRAHAAPATSCTLDDLLKERGREFYGEGMRRIDLIRFGKFTGKAYSWEYKGGVLFGTGNDANIPEYRTLYPLPISDITANPKLVQNEGY